MKNKNYFKPYGMMFKKYYCSKCETLLEKEKTHRVVSKEDVDYFKYQKINAFPRRDWDVYEYRFKCPSCNESISFEEQCIIERIQKINNKKILSISDIEVSYESCKIKESKRLLLRNILVPSLFNLLIIIPIFLALPDRNLKSLFGAAIIFFIFVSINVISAIIRHKGNKKIKYLGRYSHEHECLMKKLHVYSSNNKKLINSSNKCYCFYCKNTINKEDIKKYIDDDKTAMCPKCDIDSIIPDSIEEKIDDKIISAMHDYWF